MVQNNFSASFDRANHQWILFKLCSVEVGGSVLSVLTQFLSNRSQYVEVDGCRSKLIGWMVGGAKCFGSAVVPLVHRGGFLYSGKKLYCYADDSTVVDVVPSPGKIIVTVVTESMNLDQKRVSV